MRILAIVVFVGWCGWLSLIDLRTRRLPNALTAFGALGVLGYAVVTGNGPRAAIGGLVLAAMYLVVHLTAPAAFGAGDVKLAVGVGAAAAFGGGRVWVAAAALAPLTTAFVGLMLLARRPRRAQGPVLVPHGPSMCVATLFSLACGG